MVIISFLSKQGKSVSVENECLTGKHDCDPNAICRDNEQSFTCECAQGYTDRSPNRLNRPGRVCVQVRLFRIEQLDAQGAKKTERRDSEF